MTTEPPLTDLKTKLNQETAKIKWHELQRFFASGNAIWVSQTLDLIEVAEDFATDNTAEIKKRIDEKTIGNMPDELAAEWYEQNKSVWTVVIAPWVLVQDK